MCLEWLLFPTSPLLLGRKYVTNSRWFSNPIEVVTIFLIIFEIHVNTLSIIKVKIHVLVKCLYKSPPK